MAKLAIVLLVLVSACESKPVKSRRPSATEKATPGPVSTNLVEVQMTVVNSPRRRQELEMAVFKQPAFLECLKAALRASPVGSPFLIELSGRLHYTGSFDQVTVDRAPAGHGPCFHGALRALPMGRGHDGEFRFRIERQQDAVQKGKGVLIDLTVGDGKIFESSP